MKKNLIYSGMIAALMVSATVKTNAQWSLTGNSITSANFLGTTNAQDLRFRAGTATGVKMTLKTSGRLGIGITAPKYKLDVQGGSGTGDTIVINSVVKFTGTKDAVAIQGTSQPNPGYGIGVQGNGNDIGVYGNGGNYGVVANAIGTGVYASAVGFTDTTTATGNESDGVDGIGGPGNTSVGVYAQAGGGRFNYGLIGLCGPAYSPADSDNTHSNWAGYFFGDVVYSRAFRWSDAKLKNNIQPVASALEKLNQIQTSTYTFKKSEYPQLALPSGNQIGFIAENLEKLFPELVTVTRSPKISEGKYGKISRESVTYKSVDYEGMIPVTVAAIKEQQQQLNAKDAQIADLNARLTALEAKISGTSSAKLSSTTSVDASLEQNNPNPFSQSTQIRYTVPATYNSANITITSIDGKSVRSYTISGTGKGQITLNANELSVGSYVYSLNVDGKVIDSKTLVLTK